MQGNLKSKNIIFEKKSGIEWPMYWYRIKNIKGLLEHEDNYIIYYKDENDLYQQLCYNSRYKSNFRVIYNYPGETLIDVHLLDFDNIWVGFISLDKNIGFIGTKDCELFLKNMRRELK